LPLFAWKRSDLQIILPPSRRGEREGEDLGGGKKRRTRFLSSETKKKFLNFATQSDQKKNRLGGERGSEREKRRPHSVSKEGDGLGNPTERSKWTNGKKDLSSSTPDAGKPKGKGKSSDSF